jgi:serine/threonine-protein kinase ATR
MSPFWRSIAVTVVKNLNSKPQMAQNVADLIGISVNQFLVLTQTDTLPYLVLKKHHDLLSRIASARGTTIRNTCTQPRKNLARILALLLLQPWPDLERMTMEYLCAAATGFSEDNIATWVQLEPVMIACEMLKAAGDEETGKKPEVLFQGLRKKPKLM